MAIHSYVTIKYISGLTVEDAQMEVRQAVEEGVFEIADPERLIASDIFQTVETYVDPRYRLGDIVRLVRGGGEARLRVVDDGTDQQIRRVMVKSDRETEVYYCTLDGDIRSRQVFVVSQIDDADVGYLVSEQIVHPESGIMLVERCYRRYFRDLRSAIQYRDAKMKGYVHAKGVDGSGWRLTVVDINIMENDSWYKSNLKVSEDIKRYGLDVEDYRYLSDPKLLRDSIRADAYDDLEQEDQDDVNYGIYMAVRNFIEDDACICLDEEMDDAGPGELEGIADTAIILALISCHSQEEMEKVSEALGPNEYRIGALTDDIYNAHADEGYILVSLDGDMCWYGDVKYANSWEGNEDNPWFGKFQPNENDTLLCFKEYHPELIVDRLPRPDEMRALERKYIETMSEERRRHDEMHVEVYEDENGTDVDVCVGTWYFEGVASSKSYEGIHFMLDYGTHRFTEEECRSLLSGDEVTVEGFMTKVGRAITIRGKLKDCSTMFDKELNIQYTRTDIDNNARRRMDMDFGFMDITEPGLPSDSDGMPVGI